ncbi:hypothetical protein P170DRAFT_366065 [Aspergillus steynii IBT 23096]|uniref:Thioesterase family protein n=1 Tax=Aspergillus steynii IBT 23096 TaxID=1392250 RepID=A0A2I2FXA7_9EURO|nr:uncharacterized protein P170DRAFT_366065 [Aspergillus steynii IBT 23096]PLB45243.1 hypothetical protein P170DRAFT_366065 [Aspergillus steynii IBT 23096]
MSSLATSSPLLDAASSITQENGARHRFVVDISPEWTTQHSVLGGFLNVMALSATRKFLAQEFGDAQYPDPIHAFVQFLKMVPPGLVSLCCTCLRVSSRQCVVRVELAQTKSLRPPRDPASTSTAEPAAVAIVTYADLSKEHGLTQTAANPTIPSRFPDRVRDCAVIDDPIVDATPVTSKLNWVAPRASNGLWGHRLGGHQREVWISFRDGSAISDVLHLALLSDMPLQPPATHEPKFYERYALFTLCLSVEFKKRPHPSTQWVLVKSNSHTVRNGRYDVQVQILAENGDLLALSHHVLHVFGLRAREKAKM